MHAQPTESQVTDLVHRLTGAIVERCEAKLLPAVVSAMPNITELLGRTGHQSVFERAHAVRQLLVESIEAVSAGEMTHCDNAAMDRLVRDLIQHYNELTQHRPDTKPPCDWFG